MKFSKLLFSCFFILNSSVGFSQDKPMSTSVEKIKKLGRDSIIQLGFRSIKKFLTPNTSIKDFDKVTVLVNKNSLWVLFSCPIVYIPLNSLYYYQIGIDLISGTTVPQAYANPEGFEPVNKEILFFSSTAESKKNTQFVVNAISKNDSANLTENLDGRFIIREQKEYYAITYISTYQGSSYKIDKLSGKIYDAAHEHYVPEPEKYKKKQDKLIEIFQND